MLPSQVRQDVKANRLEVYEWAKKHNVYLHTDNLNLDKMGSWVAQQRIAFDLVILGLWFWREMQTDRIKSIPETVVHRGSHKMPIGSPPSECRRQVASLRALSAPRLADRAMLYPQDRAL